MRLYFFDKFEALLLGLLCVILFIVGLQTQGDKFEWPFVLLALLCVTAGYLGYRIINRRRLHAAQREAERQIQTAQREAETIRREAEVAARSEQLAARELFEKQTADKRRELDEHEKTIIARQASLQEKLETVIRREEELRESELKIGERHKELDALKSQAQSLVHQREEELQRVAGLSQDEARQLVLQRVESNMQAETAALTRRAVEDAKARADREAKRILTIAIERSASDHVSETTTSTVPLPNEEMKGRIIGREGRNIRSFEAATGVSAIIDDTPQLVVLSGFDPVRREIARIALERLIADGRIHPARIEEVVQKVQLEMEELVRQAGEDACFRAGVHGVNPEVVKLLGRLKYRHSYSQNVLDHSVEVVHLVAAMAAELGLDVPTAKRVGLFHDVGKAVSNEVEGSHALIGADLLRKFGEPPDVCLGVASHHEEVEPNIFGVLASAGDAISASRAGARSESAAIYLQRLEKLEQIANAFEGVTRSYAIQAGREVRVVVEPTKVDDNGAATLAHQIARRIESELQYPGQIKVTVMRETRVVDVAK